MSFYLQEDMGQVEELWFDKKDDLTSVLTTELVIKLKLWQDSHVLINQKKNLINMYL